MNDPEAASGGAGEAEAQESLVAAMMNPAFYPKPPPEITHKETHISHLFFAGELVYKIKKAVRYSFLDYSTLARRRFYLNEELRLNRRLSPSVYLGVMPISCDEQAWRLGGWAEPAEYVLVMRRLPERRMLPFLLETRQVTPQMMRALAKFVGKFYTAAEPARGIEPSRWPALVAQQWNENLNDLRRFAGASIDDETIEAIRRFGADFLDRHSGLLAQRAEQGWIRDVHGDLHCDHICFPPEGIQIFDCIEFSSKLRLCDLAAEVAFLVMDLEVRGGQALIMPFLKRYGELIDDPAIPELLPFYQCYRALVRGKVHALRRDGAAQASRYFEYAARLAWQPFQPFLVIICGPTGSGKSTLAGELGRRLGLRVINSDVVRKTMAQAPGPRPAPLNRGIYSFAMTERTYAKLARETEKTFLHGKGAILDATYGRRAKREQIIRLAESHGVPWFIIRCSASDEVIFQRLSERAAVGESISDGRWEVYLNQKAAYEPIIEVSPRACLELNTEPSLDRLARACESFLRSRLTRVRD